MAKKSLLFLSLLLAMATGIRAEQYGDWTYLPNTNGWECRITGYTGSDRSSIVIPKQINGYTVTSVSADFSGYSMVTLAFYQDTQIALMPYVQNCKSLTKIELIDDAGQTVATNRLPDSMTDIANAFKGSGISYLTMPNVTTVGDFAFEGCNNLQSVTFEKAAYIGDCAFQKITPADEEKKCVVTYPGPMSDWSWTKYQYSKNLVVDCTDGSCGWCGDKWNNTLYQDACLLWTLDTSGHLNIDCIPLDDFFENYGPQQVLRLPKTFWDKSLVKSITLNRVYRINNSAFKVYPDLETVVIGSGLVSIGNEAFTRCTQLKTVVLPATLTKLEEQALSDCSSLSDLYFEGSEYQWNHNVTKSFGWNNGVSSSFVVHWRCAVTFDMHGHGTAPDSQSPWSSEGATVTRPADPTANGYVFTGWYTDADCTTLYDFNTEVNHDLTIHAGWASQPCAATLTAAETVDIPYGQEWTEIPVTVSSLTLGWFQNEGQPARQAHEMKVTPFIGSGAGASFYFIGTSGNLTAYRGIGEKNLGNGLSKPFTEAGGSTNLWVYIPQETWESAEGGSYVQSLNYDAVFFCTAVTPAERYNYYETIGIGNIGQVTVRLNIPQAVTLTFDANGGNGEMTPVNTRMGFAAQVPDCAFTNGENLFIEWNTEPDGSGTTYLPGEELTVQDDVTLYAQWGKEYVIDLTGTSELVVPDMLLGELTTLGGYFENIPDDDGNDQMILDLNLDGTPDLLMVFPEYDFEEEAFVGEPLLRKLAGADDLTANYRFRLDFELDEAYQLVLFKFGNNYDEMAQPVVELLYCDIDNTYYLLPDLEDGRKHSVMLYGNTLFRNGVWNTLCLPFDLNSLASTSLEGATVMALTSSTFADGTLTLNFSAVSPQRGTEGGLQGLGTLIPAGTPFLVKLAEGANNADLMNPVFHNVIINNVLRPVETDVVTFQGHYGTMSKEEDRSMLFLDYNNRLDWPQSLMTFYAFTGWFQLKGNLEARENVQNYVLNLGDEVITGTFGDNISTDNASQFSVLNSQFFAKQSGKAERSTLSSQFSNGWYTLDGRKLSGKPTAKGVYLWNNKKIIVK